MYYIPTLHYCGGRNGDAAMYYVQFCSLEHTHVTIAADDAHIEVTHPRGRLSLKTTNERGELSREARRVGSTSFIVSSIRWT